MNPESNPGFPDLLCFDFACSLTYSLRGYIGVWRGEGAYLSLFGVDLVVVLNFLLSSSFRIRLKTAFSLGFHVPV